MLEGSQFIEIFGNIDLADERMKIVNSFKHGNEIINGCKSVKVY